MHFRGDRLRRDRQRIERHTERALDRVRDRGRRNKAYFLYVTQTPAEKAKLLRMVLSNCVVDALSVYPTYRKPFDMIFERAKNRGMVGLGGLEPPTSPLSG